MNLRAPRLLITDLDNTLYSWVGFIVPALEAMTSVVAHRLGRSEEHVRAALQQVFSEEDTTDYAFVLQRSPLFDELGGDFSTFNRDVITPAKEAYGRARRENLRAYPGVPETLAAFRERAIPVVGLTDAPISAAEQRLKSLGLDPFLQALFGMPAYTLPSRQDTGVLVDPLIVEKHRSGSYRSAVPSLVELERAHEKPHAGGVLGILDSFGVAPQDAWYVGDHPTKDAGAAAGAGVPFFWAEYGSRVPEDLRERLSAFSPAHIQRRHTPAGTLTSTPLATLGAFRDLLDHLPQ